MDHFHVGSNVPESLPEEGDVYCFEEVWDAAIAFRKALRRAINNLPEDMNKERLNQDLWLGAHSYGRIAELIAANGGITRDVNDGRSRPIRYWVNSDPSPTESCEL